MSKRPKPKREPKIVVTSRGPSLSVSLPPIMLNKPSIKKANEKPPESIARSQPKSASIGLKNMPKVKNIPQTTSMMTKTAATTM